MQRISTFGIVVLMLLAVGLLVNGAAASGGKGMCDLGGFKFVKAVANSVSINAGTGDNNLGSCSTQIDGATQYLQKCCNGGSGLARKFACGLAEDIVYECTKLGITAQPAQPSELTQPPTAGQPLVLN